jgi:hypothetical protein
MGEGAVRGELCEESAQGSVQPSISFCYERRAWSPGIAMPL